MTLNLTIPQTLHTDFTPRITVIGVGGGGTNAVDNMIALNLQGVEFVVANTDAQQLMHSRADRRIQLGPHLTQGLGAGAKPEIGRAAAEEAADELTRHLDGAHMVFITAGMGGGTGTGAAPVIARMARERGILTVGVVTKPFTFEGVRRARAADTGISELQQFVDTLIVIPNQNLFRLATERTGWKEAFKMADHVLYMGVRGVTDLMVAPGLVNLDFADIRTVMAEMGKAMMGTGEAEGENRAVRAAEAANQRTRCWKIPAMSGARGLLINITGGDDMTLYEVDQAANRIREEVAEDANIIFGSAIDETAVRPRPRVGRRDRHRHPGAGRAGPPEAGRGGRRPARERRPGEPPDQGDDRRPRGDHRDRRRRRKRRRRPRRRRVARQRAAGAQRRPRRHGGRRPRCCTPRSRRRRRTPCRSRSASTRRPAARSSPSPPARRRRRPRPPQSRPRQPRHRARACSASSPAPSAAPPPPSPDAPRTEPPSLHAEPQAEVQAPPRAQPTPTEEAGLDIPAFLRRQSS